MHSIPTKMRAFVLTGFGGLEKLELTEDWPVPKPDADEVLIQVHACGLNNTDINTRTAWYSTSNTEPTTGDALPQASDDGAWSGRPLQFPHIQGADVVGEVVAVGGDVDPALLGSRVLIDTWLRDWSDPDNREKMGYFGSECPGGFAQYTKVHQHNVHPIDSDLSSAQLATFPTAYITAENMLNRAGLSRDETVLISGASGGVGSALIQLSKRRGARPLALCAKNKMADVAKLAPTAVIDRDEDIATALSAAIGKDQVDVLADVVGGERWSSWIECLARKGRYTCAGAIAGPIVSFDLRTFYLRDLSFYGATTTPANLFAQLVRYIEQGEIKPLLAATYPLEQLPQAQRSFIEKKHVGNIVVTL